MGRRTLTGESFRSARFSPSGIAVRIGLAARRAHSTIVSRARRAEPVGQAVAVDAPAASDRVETFEIDSDLTRDAIYAGIWTRLCVEIRSPPEENRLEQYVTRLSEGRGDPAEVLGYLETDLGWLAEARRRLTAVGATPLGSTVELDDVRRFMPTAWGDEAGRWLYTDTEIEQVEEHGGHVTRVRELG
jgi:hypothetical protein